MLARRRRAVERFEFTPPQTAGVLAEMGRLAAAGDGWVNLLPGMASGAAGSPAGGPGGDGLVARSPAVTMGTWIPAGGRGGTQMGVGLLHPRGRLVVRQLEAVGMPVPDGWRVRQDNARRGLVLGVPATVAHGEVLDWLLDAGRALCAEPLTGRWQAAIYQPRAA